MAEYPHYEEVVRPPNVADLFYGTIFGPHNETWYFAASAILTSIILPSQFSSYCSAGQLTNGTYEEAIDIFLYETRLTTSPAQTYLLATGSYNGTVNYGQELNIPLRNATVGRAPRVGAFVSNNSGFWYTVSIVFKKAGIYPWYNTRALSLYSLVNAYTNGPGIAIGLSYDVL